MPVREDGRKGTQARPRLGLLYHPCVSTRERLWPAAGLGFVAVISLRDIASPDLFWHLNVGRRILETGVLPSMDVYSHTKLGMPWREYEWLADILWASLEGRFGALGLLALKAGLLTGAAACILAVLRLQGWGGRVQGLAALALAAGWHLVDDVRPDNFTLLFFSAELLALEAGRLGRLGAGGAAAFFLGGALWANLHPGFAYGLCLPPLYALDAARRRAAAGRFLIWEAALLVGSFVNPLGPSLLLVLVDHARHAGEFGARIIEWRRPGADWNCLPFWLLLAGTAAAFWKTRPRSLLPWGLCLGTVAWALASQRAIPYFLLAAAAALGQLRPARSLNEKKAALLAALLLAYFVRAPGRLTTGWNLTGYPVAAATYLETHPELAARPLYNPLAWGGYLSARLWPRYLVYMDGRSVFLDMIGPAELHKDTAPAAWQDTLERRGIGLAVMPRGVPEAYMPAARWERLFEDEAARVYRRHPSEAKESPLGR
jgi:hypothetical protein